MTCTKPVAAIYLPCPSCKKEDASIAIMLHLLDDVNAQFKCMDCEDEFGTSFVASMLRAWAPILKWMESVPRIEEVE